MGASIPGGRTERGNAALSRALVVAAVGQLVSSALVSAYGGDFTTSNRPGEPPVVPPGPAFSIWGLVIAVSVGYAIWADRAPLRGQDDARLRVRLGRPLLVTFTGFSLWLAAAELEPIWSTLVVFAAMLVGLTGALAVALRHRVVLRRWSVVGRGLLWTLLGVYTGWSSIAIWVNLTTSLTAAGAPLDGALGTAGQVAALAGATGTAVLLTRWTRGLLSYVGTVAWALIWVTFGTWSEGAPVLSVTAALGLAAVLATAAQVRRATD